MYKVDLSKVKVMHGSDWFLIIYLSTRVNNLGTEDRPIFCSQKVAAFSKFLEIPEFADLLSPKSNLDYTK